MRWGRESHVGCAGSAGKFRGEGFGETLMEASVMADGDNPIDRIILYAGIVFAVLGIAGAGFAVVRAMCQKWLFLTGV